jgi:hypothetical protein
LLLMIDSLMTRTVTSSLMQNDRLVRY